MSTTADKKTSNHKKGKGKKRSRKNEEDDDDENPPVYVAYEQRDLSVLGHIHELRLSIDVDRVVTDMYSSMTGYKAAERTAHTPVEYRPAEFKAGRLYGTGLQGVGGFAESLDIGFITMWT